MVAAMSKVAKLPPVSESKRLELEAQRMAALQRSNEALAEMRCIDAIIGPLSGKENIHLKHKMSCI